jgi:hypothetical protein
LRTAALLAPPALLALLAHPAEAKDLRGRLGVGFDNQFGNVSALSLRYALPMPDPAINIQVEGAFGFAKYDPDATDFPPVYFGGGRLHYGVVAEDNMNLTVSGGLGVLSDGDAQSLRAEAMMGAQFFLFGLENLGFVTEWGVHFDSGETNSSATDAAVGVGAHYWF